MVLIEFTSPRFEESHSIKFIRYGPGSEIFQACKNNGLEVFVFPVEVGARGYAAKSLQICLGRLGLKRKASNIIGKEAADAALRSSFLIWKQFLYTSN